jgi:hypothetical protein
MSIKTKPFDVAVNVQSLWRPARFLHMIFTISLW